MPYRTCIACGRKNSYAYSNELINHIERELAERQGIPYDESKRLRERRWNRKEKPIGKNPYINTQIKPAESKAQIYKLLNAYGAMDILFGQGWVLFRIATGSKILTVRKTVPNIKDEQIAWRYTHWGVKADLERIASKAETTETVFLQDIIIQLADGSYSTIGKEAKEKYLPSGV